LAYNSLKGNRDRKHRRKEERKKDLDLSDFL